jgi:glycosyltransferase involved in cell wall biosynthesis
MHVRDSLSRAPTGATADAAKVAEGSVALVHDYLLVMRGAERTFACITDCWPAAAIYTLLWDPAEMQHRFRGHAVHTSYLQRAGLRQPGFRRLLPLFPDAVGRLPLSAYDLVISSSSAFAHGVRTAPGAVHVCYCHSPFRYAWHEYDRALREARPYLRPALKWILRYVRAWDRQAAGRVTHYIANSEQTRERIQDFYGRDAEVVHPPVDVERFRQAVPEDYFLVVSEVIGHKRVELALEAARRAGRPIKVVGGGPELKRLARRYASAGTTFLGRLSDAELADVYARARAVVVPNVEEFGIVAVEAQAAGRPVIAANAGGTRETVIDGQTGVLFPPGDVDALAQAMRDTDFESFSPIRLSEHAQRFSPDAFRERLMSVVSGFVDAGAAHRRSPASGA